MIDTAISLFSVKQAAVCSFVCVFPEFSGKAFQKNEGKERKETEALGIFYAWKETSDGRRMRQIFGLNPFHNHVDVRERNHDYRFQSTPSV